jgi:vacuolar-type H+-ATPase subunit B/Vma2
MDRAIPEINKYVTERQIRVNKNLHKQKLRSVGKIIDMSEPSSLSYPFNKAKKEQMIDGKPFLFNHVR